MNFAINIICNTLCNSLAAILFGPRCITTQCQIIALGAFLLTHWAGDKMAAIFLTFQMHFPEWKCANLD